MEAMPGVSGCISKNDIGPNDVLCGRGNRSNPGNAAFLDTVRHYVSDYFSNGTHREKQRIAAEIVHHVRNNVDPPGRFLAAVDDTDLWWRQVEDKVALEKAKQALRNLKKDHARQGQNSGGGGLRQEESQDRSERQAALSASVGASVEGTNSLSAEIGGPTDALIVGRLTTLSFDHPEVATSTSTTASLRREEGEEANTLPHCEQWLDSIHIAHELTKKIRVSHDAGVAYFTRSPINPDGQFLPGDSILSDLTALGSQLHRVFAGVDPSGNRGDGTDEVQEGVEEATTALHLSSTTEVGRTKKRERRVDSRTLVALRDLGLPVSLCILVSSLMDAMDNEAADRYKRIEEVEEDLRLMTIDPERYLFDAKSDALSGRLTFLTGKLYGREQRTAELMHCFDRVIGSGGIREIVLISGRSGTGKSVLVDQLRQPLSERRGHFISIKFDEQGQVQPMTVIFSAFNDFCTGLLHGDEEVLALVRRSLKEALGANINVLVDIIPSLSYVIGEPISAAAQVEGKEALHRLLFYFRLMVRAIASPLHPAIVFLDDLQWVDKASLEFLFMTMMDGNVPSLLFVGCYRSNEVGPDHPLKSEIRNISSYGVGILPIALDNIDRKDVNALVSDTLHMLPRVTQSLSDIVYAKTAGNPMLVVQFLRSLCDENLLRYSASSRRWQWEVESIQAKNIADNVVDLMTQKMLKLDPDVQWLLKVAACLGSQSEASTLKLLSSNADDDGSGIIAVFDLAVNEGLMSRMGSRYKFSHDQIQQAAYSLIPEGERNALHLNIGRILRKKATEKELNKIVFLVVDQLFRGSNLLSDDAEKVGIARLCLTAGEMAMTASSFLQASICLMQGSMLLGDNDWENNYHLSLELFTCCAEAQYACGNLDGATITLGPILQHGKCLQDKLRAYFTLLKSLGSLGKLQDTVDRGLNILAQLGEPLESESSDVQTVSNFAQILLEWETDKRRSATERILEKEEMHDKDKLAAMMVLSILFEYTYQSHQHLMALIVLRMVKLSLSHGVCKESSVGFATYGSVLCAFGEVAQGYRYGKLAISIIDRFNAKELLARVYLQVHGLINIFTEPVQAGLDSLKHGYEVGMSLGDIEGAMSATHMYNLAALHCGRQLGPLLEEVRGFVRQVQEHKHHTLPMQLISCQAIMNLIDSQDPTVLTGEAMDQDAFIQNTPTKLQMLYLSFTRMWLAYLFMRYEIAAEMAETLRNIGKARPIKGAFVVNLTFFTGLTAVIMVRDGKAGEWRSMLSETKEKLTSWVKNSSWNFQHKLDLLNAEIAYYLNGDLHSAGEAYNAAIHTAGEHGFVHEQALACERAGIMYSEALSAETAASYFQRAKMHYREWGATRKAESVLQIEAG